MGSVIAVKLFEKNAWRWSPSPRQQSLENQRRPDFDGNRIRITSTAEDQQGFFRIPGTDNSFTTNPVLLEAQDHACLYKVEGLAAGVPDEDVGNIAGAGAVNAIYGSSERLSVNDNELALLKHATRQWAF